MELATHMGQVAELSAEQGRSLFRDGLRKAGAGRYEAVVALTSLERTGRWRELGYSSLLQLASREGDLSRREARELLRVGRTLLAIPALDEAFRSERLSWSKVRALVPVVKPENAAHWIRRAQQLTATALEREVAGRREPVTPEGDVPFFPVPQEVWQRFQRLARLLRGAAGDPGLSDVECLEAVLGLAEERLEGASPVERAPAQAGCAPAPRSRFVPAAVLEALRARAGNACEAPHCGNVLGLVVHHAGTPFAAGGPHTLSNLQLLCGLCHTVAHASP